jgi:hypothetical protein
MEKKKVAVAIKKMVKYGQSGWGFLYPNLSFFPATYPHLASLQ